MKINWKNIVPHISALIIFVIVAALYFNPQLQGKQLPMGDIVSFEGMANEAKEYEERTGEQTLWTNSMFGGMPTFQISAKQKSNVAKYIEKTSQLFLRDPLDISYLEWYFFISP